MNPIAESALFSYSVLVHNLDEEVCMELETDEQEIIENTTWATDIFSCGDVVVRSGAILTVTGRAYFNPNAKLTVEAGARLVVDGGTLTTHCPNANWQGVLVQGTPNVAPSIALNGPHGFVHLIDGAVIEHAKVGVSAVTGGIVRSNGGGDAFDRITFRNCRKGIELKPYSYAGSSTATPSAGSYMLRTDFVCDAPMNDPSYVSGGQRIGVNEFVSAWLYPHTRIIDCSFTNTITYSGGSFAPHVRGLGVIAIDTKLNVTNCEFNGMYRGVTVMRTINNPTSRLHLSNSTFINTMQGLVSEGSIADLIEDNKFYVPSQSGTPNVPTWGAYMLRAQHYKVIRNEFDKAGTSEALGRGFVNRGSDDFRVPTAGLLFDNDFTNTFIGTQVEKHNIYLKMLCNDYTDVSADWVINWQSVDHALGPQGTGCDPDDDYRAGNKFFDGSTSIWSQAAAFQYFYPVITNYLPYFTGSMTPMPCDNVITETSCPMENPCTGNPAPCIVSYDDDIETLEAEKSNLIAALDSNGTKTTVLLARLADTTYSNTTLKNELLQWSLLSDTVLKATCLRHPFFNEDHILSVLLQNSPVTNDVWPYVEDILDEVKEEYADSIVAAQSSNALRTVRVIEREKKIAESERYHVVFDHLQSFLDLDSIPDSTYLMIHYLTDSIVGKQWKQMAVGTALSVDTLTLARTLLEELDLENREDTAFYNLHDLAITLKEDTLTWFEMDSTQQVLIEELASGETMMKNRAEAILAMLEDTSVVRTPEEFELPSERRGVEEENEPMSSEMVSVYPNPFSGNFTIQYKLREKANQIRFEVFDLTGRRIRDAQISGSEEGSQQLMFENCEGFYVLRVTADRRVIRTEKLIAVKP
jgi:hypothetical protein